MYKIDLKIVKSYLLVLIIDLLGIHALLPPKHDKKSIQSAEMFPSEINKIKTIDDK